MTRDPPPAARRPPGDDDLPAAADVVVIGAGLVGACCARWLAAAGQSVCVVDRGGPVAGTTAGGEGNILVSDKPPGPELGLALRSITLWAGLAASGGEDFEFERKGGLVVARDQAALSALSLLAGQQRGAGVAAEQLGQAGLRSAEPQLAAGVADGVWYPQDCQVQPMLAAAAQLAEARRLGARLAWGADVLGADTGSGGRVRGLRTSRGPIAAGAVVNAAGPWSGIAARRLGAALPVRPRRGHILVTEPLPPLIRHKVYEADYVATVASDADAVQCSPVIESTRSGTILIGSSREFAGFDRGPSLGVLAAMARRAVSLFPVLAGIRVIRGYTGFRPASPDHLPLIGPDPAVGGLYHATGHEGAGIGLAPATAELITALLTGRAPEVDPAPFDPSRLAVAGAAVPQPGPAGATGDEVPW